MKLFFPVLFIFLFVSSYVNADINKEISDLKDEFKQIKEIYENKIEALEAKIEKLENNSAQEKMASEKLDSHEGHQDHSDEDGFNIEAVLNAKYTSYSLSGEAAIKGFGVAHEGERGKEGLAIGETELIINSDIGGNFSGSVTAAIVREDGADKIELEEAYVESLEGASLIDNTFFKL